jgi:hypothetical protein
MRKDREGVKTMCEETKKMSADEIRAETARAAKDLAALVNGREDLDARYRIAALIAACALVDPTIQVRVDLKIVRES